MRSQRLTYRPIDARDAGRIAVFAGDWDVARMTSRSRTLFPDRCRPLDRLHRRRRIRSRRRAGRGADRRRRLHRQSAEEAEIGYWIGKPWWGNGYATEAARHADALLLR